MKDEAGEQVVGDGLGVGEAQVALVVGVGREGLGEGGVAADGRVDAEVRLEGGEVHQDAVQLVGRHAVAEAFLRVRRGGAHQLPHLLQDGLHMRREARDVRVHGGGRSRVRGGRG